MPFSHTLKTARLTALRARWHTEPLPAPDAPATARAAERFAVGTAALSIVGGCVAGFGAAQEQAVPVALDNQRVARAQAQLGAERRRHADAPVFVQCHSLAPHPHLHVIRSRER